MSRSKHTRPRAIRAADRLRKPRDPRGAGDPSRTRRRGRALKERGILLPFSPPRSPESWPLPRISVARARPGYAHPADSAAIAGVLRFFGEESCYGLQTIELRRGEGPSCGQGLGRLLVPGRILLFDQAPSPWCLRGRLSAAERDRLEQAGAELESCQGAVLVHWSEPSLRDFMLFDVLMHEVGHHLLQHHKGKRRLRIARTRHHEHYAEAFARRCRAAFRERNEEQG